MKVLILAYDYRPNLGGIATASYELAKALAAISGISVRILAPSADIPEQEVESDSHGFFETRRRPMSDSTFMATLQFIQFLRVQVKEWKPDVIVNTLWIPCSVGCWFGMRFGFIPRLPFFTLVHGVEVLESKSTFKKRIRGYLRPIKWRVFRRSAAIFAISNFTAEIVEQECRISRKKIIVTYNGVDAKRFHPAEKPKYLLERYGLQEKIIFYTVCRLEDYKGVDRAIDSFRLIKTRHPDAVYLIAGPGPDRPRLERMVSNYQLDKDVYFLGKLPEAELNDHYNLCDIFVLLSREDRFAPNFEGLGLVLLEAGACGKPAIAGKSGGMPEVVVDRLTGWTVFPEDDLMISEVMSIAITDDLLREQFGKAARERVLRYFKWEGMAQLVLTELERHVRN